ncbi:MAG: TrkA family potassium uptake protein [Candidatus Woesearchaeota archaeon]|nr:MAG: TrkA family potassium uptake protein [Candidatus Woesearchaeota archaeon]
MRQIAVIGLGNFGSTVAKELTQRGAQVIAIDKNRDLIENIKDSVTYAVALDSTDASALKAIGIQNIDAAVVGIGEDIEANLLTTLLLKKIGVKNIWARAISPLQQEILNTLEVDHILNLEEEMGKIVTASLASTNITKLIPISPKHNIAELTVPKSLMGKTIREIDPRRKFNINIVAIKKRVPAINELGERILEEKIENVPSPDAPLEENDIFLIVGTEKNINKFSTI